jgi:putative ABC transport system permease protein
MNPLRLPLGLLGLAWRNLWRRPLRSGLTIAGIAMAMFLFTMVGSMRSGVREATEPSPDDRTLVVYRLNRWCPFTSRLPQWYEQRIARLDGVERATPTTILVSNCRASLDVVTFRGVPAESFERQVAPSLRLREGDLGTWLRRGDAAWIGESLAERRRLRVGDRLSSAGIVVTIAGIFTSDHPQERNSAFVHLPLLQEAQRQGGIGGEVTQFDVVVAPGHDLGRVAAAIDAEFAREEHPTSTRPEKAFVARAAGDVVRMVEFAAWLGIAALVAVFALVANAMVLALQDRGRDHAVLRTLGFTGGQLGVLTTIEGVLLGIVGGGLGTLLAWSLLRSLRWSLTMEGMNMELATNPGLALAGVAIAVAIGTLAGALPGVAAARREIAANLRIA